MNLEEARNAIAIHNWELQKAITESVDLDGVIDESKLELLESIETDRLELVGSLAQGVKGYGALAKMTKTRIDELKAVEAYYKNTAESLTKMVRKLVSEGEKIESVDYLITWRKSQYVDIGDTPLETIELQEPSAIKISKSLDRVTLKNLLKHGTIVEGARLSTRNNMTIK